MAILDGLEVLLADATSQQPIPEFDTKQTSEWSTVRSVIKCVGVVDEQKFQIKIRALPGFDWIDAHCLRCTLDFDGGEVVNRYELYLLRDDLWAKSLALKEPVFTKVDASGYDECCIQHLYIPSPVIEEYCQKGRFVFRNLRQNEEQPGSRKTVQQVAQGQGRIRIEILRLQIKGLPEAEEILLLKPSTIARAHKEVLESNNITIETRIDLDDDYERLPVRRFITKPIAKQEAKKQLNFLFQYREEGVIQPYDPSSYERGGGGFDVDEPQSDTWQNSRELTQQEVASRLASRTRSPEVITTSEDQELVASTSTDIDDQDTRVVESRRTEKASQRNREIKATPEPSEPAGSKLNYSSLENAEQHSGIDEELSDRLVSSLKDTKIEYREAQILRRREQARKRKATESEFEALDHEIQEGKGEDFIILRPMMVRAKQHLRDRRAKYDIRCVDSQELGYDDNVGSRKRRRTEG